MPSFKDRWLERGWATSVAEFGGSATIRATIQVNPDGQSFTADYTVELSEDKGVTRRRVWPRRRDRHSHRSRADGYPVGSLEELFGVSKRAPKRHRRPRRSRYATQET